MRGLFFYKSMRGLFNLIKQVKPYVKEAVIKKYLFLKKKESQIKYIKIYAFISEPNYRNM